MVDCAWNWPGFIDLILNDIATNVWHFNTNALSVRVYDDGFTSFFDNHVNLNVPESP